VARGEPNLRGAPEIASGSPVLSTPGAAPRLGLSHVAVALAIGLAVLWPAQAARAHGDEPRIEVDAQRTNPGASLTVRGYDFSYDEIVALTLIGRDREVLLGSVTTDVEGAFTHVVVMPIDLAEGAYTVVAAAGHHVATAPQLFVQSTPRRPNDGDTRLEDGDSLLTPMPTATLPVAGIPAENDVKPVRAPSPRDGNSVPKLVPVIVVAGLVVVVVGWSADRRRRTHRQERTV
jgi:hypothetical protein